MELFNGGAITAFAFMAFGVFVLVAVMTRADLGKPLQIEADPLAATDPSNIEEWKRTVLPVIGGATARLPGADRTQFIAYVRDIADGHKVWT
jgi:hypothetical protein